MAKRKTGAKQTQNRDIVADKIKYNAGDMGLGEAKSKITSKVESRAWEIISAHWRYSWFFVKLSLSEEIILFASMKAL